MSSLRKTEALAAADGSASETITGAETAEYIEDMLRQLERLAAGVELKRLSLLIGEARDEARRQAFG